MKNNKTTISIKNSRRKYILAVGFVFLLIISALIFSLFQQGPKPDPSSEKVIRDKVERYIKDKGADELTEEDFAKITDLSIGDPAIYAVAKKSLSRVELADIKLLEKCTNLETLHIEGVFYPEKSIPKYMRFLGKYGIVDLNKRYVIDLTPLKSLKKLKNIQMSMVPVKDIKPLSGLVQLKELHINNIELTDIQPVRGLTNLESLILYGTKIKNIDVIKGLTKLKNLSLNGMGISDIKAVENLTNLRSLAFGYTEVSDLEPLRKLKKLESLSIMSTKVLDLKPIEGLTELQQLWINSTLISDIEPIKSLTKLQTLYMPGCKNITDEQIEDLQKALPDLQIQR